MEALTDTEENKKNDINGKISEWTKEMNMVKDFATTHLQTANAAYVTSTNISWHTSEELFPILRTSLIRSMRFYKIN